MRELARTPSASWRFRPPGRTPYAGAAVLGQDATSAKTLLVTREPPWQSRRNSAGSSKVCFFTDAVKLRSLARLDIARELREAIANRDERWRNVGRRRSADGPARRLGWVPTLDSSTSRRGAPGSTSCVWRNLPALLLPFCREPVLSCLQQDFTALASQWDADVRISFGALRHHILHEDFAADITRFLAEGAVPAQCLELRIAEKTFLACDPMVLRSLERLGVQLVVDEVGRGLGSLDTLARAPIWGLPQLDRAWVTALHGDEEQPAVPRWN